MGLKKDVTGEFAQTALCTCAHIRMASRAVTQAYDSALQPSGLRATQFSVLAKLTVAGEATAGDLARRMGMDRTTLTRNLRPLERDGLIRIAVGQDRRSRDLTLTGKGQAVLERALPLWRSVQDRMVRGLGGRRWRRLLEDLTAASESAG